MAGVRVYLEGERFGAVFKASTYRQADRVREAIRGVAEETAEAIEERGREDIEGAGNFGSRWIEGFRVVVTEGGGNIRIEAMEDVPYWSVFEYGAVISGKPLLWIPFSFADDAKGVWARDYGPLFRVDRKEDELPILFSWEPGTPDSAEPKYFGKEEVTEPKLFHLRDIIREEARKIPERYRERLKG